MTRAEIAQKLIAIWEEILNQKQLSKTADFFELGGTSLLATQLISRIYHHFNVELILSSIFEYRTPVQLAEIITEKQKKDRFSIEPIPQHSHYGLSHAQRRLWIIHEILTDKRVYNIARAYSIKGPLDLSALESSVDFLVKRHEILRTFFKSVNGDPRQFIANASVINLQQIDLSNHPNAEEKINIVKEAEANHSFDLTAAPLFRFKLLKVSDQLHYLLLTIHHIIADGMSINLIFKEIWSYYSVFKTGHLPNPKPLSFQFKDYAHHHYKRVDSPVMEPHRQYWIRKLRNAQQLDLPCDFVRPNIQEYEGGRVRRKIPSSLTEGLQAYSLSIGSSMYMTLIAAVHVLLHKYTGNHQISTGIPVNNRNTLELEDQIGFYINTLVLNSRLDEISAFTPFVLDIKQLVLEAHEHKQYPFDKLVNDLVTERDTSRHPLFDVLVTMNEEGILAGSHLKEVPDELMFEEIKSGYELSKFDLLFGFTSTQKELIFTLKYNRSLFRESTATRMFEHFEQLLKTVIEDPNKSIGDVNIHLPSETTSILKHLSRKKTTDYPNLLTLWKDRVQHSAQAIAIQHPGGSMSYQDLDLRSEKISQALMHLGVGAEVIVAIYMERTIELPLAVLSILKAGGAWLPLNPSDPIDRNRYILNDARPKLIICNSDQCSELDSVDIRTTNIHELEELSRTVKSSIQHKSRSENQLMYVIYTSGSTGQPKGVLLEDRTLNNLINWQINQKSFGTELSTLQHSTQNFDVYYQELLSSLMSGGKLHLMPTDVSQNPAKVLQFMTEHGIERIFLPYAALQLLSEVQAQMNIALIKLKEIITAGEKLIITESIRRFMQGLEKPTLVNQYGPSEAHVVSSFVLEGDPSNWPKEPVIGQPISRTDMYVAQGQMAYPQLLGLAGELYLGGIAIARGYLNQPALTKEKFVELELDSGKPPMHMYKTGDLACLQDDGNFQFKGRLDNQIKIKGYRVEPGEIEATMSTVEGIRQAIVLPIRNQTNTQSLVAWYQTKVSGEPSSQVLKTFLQKRLPDYMVPTQLIEIDQFPVLANGKIALKKLVLPGMDQANSKTSENPSNFNADERQLIRIWEETLQVSPIGIHDNFFDLGGYSLLLVQLLWRIQQEMGLVVSMADLWQNPSISGILELKKNQGAQTEIEWVSIEKELQLGIEVDELHTSNGSHDFKNVLLTGATGFIGAFLLHDLLRKTHAKVYCLVRNKNEISGKERLLNNLERYGLMEQSDMQRVVAIDGDLSLPKLGMNAEDYAQLSKQVDQIYHNGAYVNFTSPYDQSKIPNVGGTRELIKLATLHRSKPIHYISTLGVFSNPDQAYDENVNIKDQKHSIVNGYAASKWVSEQLLLEARKIGLPSNIYRLGRITGSQQNGLSNEQDFFHRLLLSVLKEACYWNELSNIEIDLTPVDFVSNSIVSLSQHKNLNQQFHLINKEKITYESLFNLMARYFKMEITALPYDQWISRLESSAMEVDQSPHYLILPVLKDPNYLAKIRTEGKKKVTSRKTFEKLSQMDVPLPQRYQELIPLYFGHLSKLLSKEQLID